MDTTQPTVLSRREGHLPVFQQPLQKARLETVSWKELHVLQRSSKLARPSTNRTRSRCHIDKCRQRSDPITALIRFESSGGKIPPSCDRPTG